ncbi:prepilin peptidase [Solihabitans fulvus]|uniref:Prepilin peptidase n=1 Tax=Solihabitans fulvus TaxID=1892852 RepID=A0A5B2XFB1_9PSEU|nr:A24 family peptidase [Solihabitans fulvus]KAA2262003.1 prepilin peptidase [Solihabitans fulvus]
MSEKITVLSGLIAAFLTAGWVFGALGARLLRRLPRGASVRSPWCALATGLLWALVAARWFSGGLPPWWLPVPLALAWFGVLLSTTDLLHHRLPNALTLPAYPAVAALLTLAALTGGGTRVLAGAVLGCLAFGLLHLVVHLIVPGALGAGDVKLSGSLGAVLGALSWWALPLAGLLACTLTLVGGLLHAAARRPPRVELPHGPGLLAATWLLATFPAAAAVPL